MLRIYFTGDDVARTRLAPAPEPLWETVLSLHVLAGRQGDTMHHEWRRRVVSELQTSPVLGDVRLLLALNPPVGYFPDFLTPLAGGVGLEAGLEAIASTAPELLGRDLARLAEERILPPEAFDLARGDSAAMRRLTNAMRAYHDVAIAPKWSRIAAVVDGDRSRRARVVAGRGAEGLLESLRPAMQWRGGELHVDYPFDQEMHLDGRGLLLVPSYFCWRYPVTLLDPGRLPVLVYPAQRTAVEGAVAEQARPEANHRALAALLGATRASVLDAIGEGCTTTELARRVGISAAAASQHATVLRNAGLVTSHRDRNTVLHTVTPLGTAVLCGR
jgi:DNA-binding transcriptional ArsR family regulator